MNAIGYIRVSTEEQAAGGISLDMQRREIERFCSNRKWSMGSIFSDVMSGKNLDRPGLQFACKFPVKNPDCRRLVVWRSDRLSRAGRGDLDLLAMFTGLRIQVWSVTEGFLNDEDPDSEFMGFIRAGLNQRERRLISLRTRAVLKRKSDNGERLGRPPFGYRVEYEASGPGGKRIGHLIEVPEEHELLQRLARYQAQGHSTRAIAHALCWSQSKVVRLLRRD